jgi:hypothetical protein
MKIKLIVLCSAFAYLQSGCGANAEFASPQRKSYEAVSKNRNSFLSSEVVEGNKTITDGGRFEFVSVTMNESPATKKSFTQVERKVRSLTSKQGHDSKYRSEQFQVSSAGLLDLLIVIDDSRSMAEEQIALGQRLQPLISHIRDTNWQIAVVSMSDPCVRSGNLIRPTDANIDQKFANAVKMPPDNAATEQGFPKAIQALQDQCFAQKKWTRPGSSVGVLIVSDEDNCGSDPGEKERCNRIYGKNSDEMLEFLSYFRPTDLARVYALVKQDASSCPDASGVGAEYLKAVTATGGVHGSICEGDYTNALTQISRNVKNIIRREFTLASIPDLREFKVEADGVQVSASDAWIIDGAKVTINEQYFVNAKSIKFTYSHDAVPKFDHLVIGSTVAPESMVVKFNGAVQPKTSYIIDDNNQKVIFTPMPPDDAIVDVMWRDNTPLTTKFPLQDQVIRLDTLEVKQNGKVSAPSTYSVTNGVIEFIATPLDSTKIDATYRTEKHKILSYPIFPGKNPKEISTTDSLTNDVIEVAYMNGQVTFDREDFVLGRKISVSIDYGPKPSSYEVTLPDEVLTGTVKIKVNNNDVGCVTDDSSLMGPGDSHEKRAAIQLQSNGQSIKVLCPAENPDYAVIDVSYSYELNKTNTFKVPDTVPLGDDIRPSEWRVFIDGKETKSFKRDARTITVEEQELSPGSNVDIDTIIWKRID